MENKCKKCNNCQKHCDCVVECRKCDLESLEKGIIPEKLKVEASLEVSHNLEDIDVSINPDYFEE